MVNEPSPFRLAAFYSPTGARPSFVFPAFVFHGANTTYIQNVDVGGNIEEFEPLEVAHTHLVSVAGSAPTVTIGDPAIWAFQLSDGQILSGTRVQLTRQLEPLLRRQTFEKVPLIELEVAEFCGVKDLIAPVLQRCFGHMEQISEKAAIYWRDAVVLTPLYRAALRQAWGKKGIEVDSNLWREVQLTSGDNSRPRLWIPNEIFCSIGSNVPLLYGACSSVDDYLLAFGVNPDGLEFSAPAPRVPQGKALPFDAAEYLLAWRSAPLTRRDLNIPTGAKTNRTGCINLDRGAFEGIDFQRYFRNKLFRELTWKPDASPGKRHLLRASTEFEIVINGLSHGKHKLLITFNSDEQMTLWRQGNATTNIRWASVTELIARVDLLGKTLSIYKRDGAPPDYIIEIG